MKQQELLFLISKYFSRFTEQVKILNGNGEFSINIHAENVLINVLNIIFDSNFENVNYVEGKNYASIDLRDKNDKFSIQITATSTITKIKDTLTTYIEKEHYKKYERLLVLILTGRQDVYSQDSINKVTGEEYNFDQGEDVVDFTNLYSMLSEQNDLAKIQKVKELLEEQFSDVVSKLENPKIENFKELCKTIQPYIKENGELFRQFGPNSGAANSTAPLRRDLSLWYKSRREKILPNNKIISDLITTNKNIILEECRELFESLLAHIFAFEKHCEDGNFEYSQYRFPDKIVEIIDNECR